MTRLEDWLRQATHHLSRDSAAQVRLEIADHYESERETAMSLGATAHEADRLAVTALGDPRAANCQYRRILITAVEARILREGNWEARVICSRRWLKYMMLAMPVAAIVIAAVLFVTGSVAAARVVSAAGTVMGLFFAAPFLPVYTPRRARLFRGFKWVALISMLLLSFGPNALEQSWLLLSCLWPIAWIEWTRISIRRKLRVSEWPKHLYL